MRPISRIFGADVYFDDGVHRVFDQHQTLGYGARYGVSELGHGTVLETNDLEEAMKFAQNKGRGKSTRQIESEIREIVSSVASDDAMGPAESAKRRPAGPRPIRISAIDPATMTAGAINKELDKLSALHDVLGQRMIDAGRGHERPSEYLHKDDALSKEMRQLFDRRQDLTAEISRRYGPGAPSRLPTGKRSR